MIIYKNILILKQNLFSPLKMACMILEYFLSVIIKYLLVKKCNILLLTDISFFIKLKDSQPQFKFLILSYFQSKALVFITSLYKVNSNYNIKDNKNHLAQLRTKQINFKKYSVFCLLDKLIIASLGDMQYLLY